MKLYHEGLLGTYSGSIRVSNVMIDWYKFQDFVEDVLHKKMEYAIQMVHPELYIDLPMFSDYINYENSTMEDEIICSIKLEFVESTYGIF